MGKKDLCERCGECCRFKKPYEHFWVVENHYCPYFERLPDGRGNCRIYAHHAQHRIDEETVCISAVELAKAGLLPEPCPYAKAIPGYRSKVINYGERAEITQTRIPDRFQGGSRPAEMANDRPEDGLL